MAAREAEQKVAFSGLEKATSTDLMFTDRRNSILSYHIGRSWSKNKFDNKRKEEIKAPPVTICPCTILVRRTDLASGHGETY